MIRVDTNYIIRYFINDNEEMANIAEELLTTQEVFIANEIFAEVVYVLSGVYQISKEDIAYQISELIRFENINTNNQNILLKALDIFKTQNLDFVDCLLCAYSKEDTIITFDKRLNQCVNRVVGDFTK